MRWFAAAAPALLAAGSAPASPLHFDCDAAEGTFSEVKVTQPGPSYRIGGRLTARRLRVHARWHPVASVIVASADGKKVVALQMVGPKDGVGPLDLHLDGPGGDDGPRPTLGRAVTGEDLRFELVVERGKAKASIGDRRAELPAEVGRGAQVSVSCSTGEFQFDDLTLQAARRSE